MMTSSNGNIFRVTGLCAGNSPVAVEFLTQRPVTRSFDVFFDLRLNERLCKSWCWWFEMPSRPLWHHSNDNPNNEVWTVYIYIYVCMCINLRMYRVAASSSSHAWFLNQPVFLDKYVFPLCRNWSIIMQKIPFHGCCFKIWLKTFLHPVHALSSCYCVFYMTSKSFSHIILINRVVKPIRAIPECL